MGSYRITIATSAQADLLAVPFPFRRQINQRILKLKVDPKHAAALSLGNDQFIWLSYGWKILYRVDDSANLVTIVSILV